MNQGSGTVVQFFADLISGNVNLGANHAAKSVRLPSLVFPDIQLVQQQQPNLKLL